jgi:DMSO reductase iron-sulfur subunit
MVSTKTETVGLPLMGRLDSAGYYQPVRPDVVASSSHPLSLLPPGPNHPSILLPTPERGFTREPLVPTEPLEAGEQFRFHFDATRCIGCECCVVACNEQNGNPASVNWRRVGEIEGGRFPDTKRLYLSMGCNHCVEPSCLEGCPTGAYDKDGATGIVRHDAESCIGCQYCVWNCPYGVPQFNPERRIVTKCDMCYSKLGRGEAPACVAACPEQAIRIEKVRVADWKLDHSAADAPGLPDSGQTLSTTRITLPKDFTEMVEASRVDAHRVEPEDPHTPLIFLLTLTQLSVGGFLAMWLSDLASAWAPQGGPGNLRMALLACGMLAMAGVALNVSVLHLGRPIHAWKAMRMWRRSWLSREVISFGAFSAFAGLYSGLWLDRLFLRALDVPDAARLALGALVVASGAVGILSSARIYMVPARPSWNTSRTILRFGATALLLGPLFAAALLASCDWLAPKLVVLPALSPVIDLKTLISYASGPAAGSATTLTLLFAAAAAVASLQLVSLLASLLDLFREEASPELRGTAQLLTRRFRGPFLFRLATLVVGGILGPALLAHSYGFGAASPASEAAASSFALAAAAAFVLALASEFLGRYLFFVTVVPKTIAGAFFRS